MLTHTDEEVLEKIVELNGKCLLSGLCPKCPFRSQCLPEFLNPIPPSEDKRMNMALSVVTHNALSDAGVDISEYKWNDEEK